jgi:hypothetical protein
VHMWGVPNAGVGLLYANGHVWRSGEGCEPIAPDTFPRRAASTETGRLLIIDNEGDYLVSTEEF